MRLFLVILLLTTTITTASANPEPAEVKSEDVALGLSLGITTLSWGALFAATKSPAAGTVGLVGIMLGPTTGHWYSGRIVTWGLGLRVVGAVAATVGLVQALGHGDCHDACGSEPAGVILLPIGILAFAGGTLGDILTARGAAREYNEERRISIVPTVYAGTAGLGLAGRF
ncbi:MAG TPA: hypothetical protein VIU61_30020 [Kofleriaceae bacterium]